MAIWKVSAEKIQLFPHPDPKVERLLIGKVGMFQVVVGKDNGYTDGQIVVFAPERALLPDDLKGEYVNTDTGISYLGGVNADRVKSVRLKGELSEGITIPLEWVREKLELNSVEDIPLGEDLSVLLDIRKYEPPIPEEMAGIMETMEATEAFKHHDVEQFRLYEREFVPGERVIATIKIHGTQISAVRFADGTLDVASKGAAKKFFRIKESIHNLYWKCLKNIGADKKMREYPTGVLQAWAEGYPAQGYSYGATEPTAKFYRLAVDGQDLPLDYILKVVRNEKGEIIGQEPAGLSPELDYFAQHWTPVVYDGPFDAEILAKLAAAIRMEPISGKQLHLNEGIVVQPAVPRLSSERFQLQVKLLNPKYKPSDDDLS